MAKKTDTSPVELTARFITKTVKARPSIALVLGSGLGRFAERVEITDSFKTTDLPHYPKLSVQGHSGKIHFGTIKIGPKRSKPAVIFQGRAHFYETGSLDLTLVPIDLAHRLGASTLVVTNAAGGINRHFRPGDFMLIEDLLSLSFMGVDSGKGKPLRAAVRPFRRSLPPFDPELQMLAAETAKSLGLDLRRGVYCWLKGPSYETVAEIEMLSRLGVDAVGMSTVPEVVRALEYGMRVVGISVISNMAAGIDQKKLSHADVTETANRVRKNFEELMANLLVAMK